MQIKKEHLSVSVINYIRGLISSGKVGKGEPLPSARKLSIELGVSRTVLKQAMDSLIADGTIEFRDGAYLVKADTFDDLLSAALRKYVDDPQFLIQLSETRNLLEMYCIGRAALLADQASIDRMQASIDGMTIRVAQGAIGFEYEAAFHSEIVSASGNPIIIQIYSIFSEALFGTGKLTNYVASKRGIRITGPMEHQQILNAIKARDVQAAEKYMRMHLEFAHQRLCGDYRPWPFDQALLAPFDERLREIRRQSGVTYPPVIGVPED